MKLFITNGRDAMEEIETNPPDLILMTLYCLGKKRI